MNLTLVNVYTGTLTLVSVYNRITPIGKVGLPVHLSPIGELDLPPYILRIQLNYVDFKILYCDYKLNKADR